jgi:hypothetical protein
MRTTKNRRSKVKYQVKYRNKPHNYRLRNIHILKVTKGVLHISVEATDIKTRERMTVVSWGSNPYKQWRNTRIHFWSYDEKGGADDIRAELILLPESEEESKFDLIDRVSKDTYRAFIVMESLFNPAWEKHDCSCKRGRTNG